MPQRNNRTHSGDILLFPLDTQLAANCPTHRLSLCCWTVLIVAPKLEFINPHAAPSSPFATRILLPHHEQRRFQLVPDGVDGRAKNQVLQPPMSMRPHDDQVGVQLLGELHDRGLGSARVAHY